MNPLSLKTILEHTIKIFLRLPYRHVPPFYSAPTKPSFLTAGFSVSIPNLEFEIEANKKSALWLRIF